MEDDGWMDDGSPLAGSGFRATKKTSAKKQWQSARLSVSAFLPSHNAAAAAAADTVTAPRAEGGIGMSASDARNVAALSRARSATEALAAAGMAAAASDRKRALEGERARLVATEVCAWGGGGGGVRGRGR